MINKNNSHIFYCKPSVWILNVMFITVFIQMEIFDTFLLTNEWYWLLLCIAICFYPTIKVDETRIQKLVLFGLYPYRTVLWNNVNTQTINYVSLSLKTKEQTINTKYQDYFSSERLVKTVFGQLKETSSYTKDATKEQKFEVSILAIELIVFSVFFYYAWLKSKLEMKHINTEEIFFWFSSFWYVMVFIVLLFIISLIERFIKNEFSKEITSFLTLIVTLISVLGFVVFPKYTQFANEQNINVPVMREMKLIHSEKSQTWQPQDFKIANETFELKWWVDEKFINKKLKKGKTYFVPVYEGKYKDYFIPKDAFKEVKLINEN